MENGCKDQMQITTNVFVTTIVGLISSQQKGIAEDILRKILSTIKLVSLFKQVVSIYYCFRVLGYYL